MKSAGEGYSCITSAVSRADGSGRRENSEEMREGEMRRRRRRSGEEEEAEAHEYSTTESLFAILCIRDAHFYAFTFTGWKATSYSRERRRGGRQRNGDGIDGERRWPDVNLTSSRVPSSYSPLCRVHIIHA